MVSVVMAAALTAMTGIITSGICQNSWHQDDKKQDKKHPTFKATHFFKSACAV